MGQENQTQKIIGFNTVGRKTRPRDHIWAKTIYGIQHSGTGKSDPKDVRIQHSGTGKSDPKDDRIQHSWQENQTQRPYMGKDHIWDSTQWDRETGPKDHRIQHSWDRETRPKDHIWAKTIYGIQHSGTGKPDPKTIGFNTVGTGKPDPKTIYGQRPYMGFSTVGTGKPDPKTIYGIQHSGTGKPDPKTIYGIQHSIGTGKLDPKTMGQGNRIQRPYMGLKPDPKTIYGIQHSGTGKLDPKTIGFNTVGTGKPEGKLDPKTIYGIETGPKVHMGFNTVGTGKLDLKTIYGTQRLYGIQHSWDMQGNLMGNRIQRPYRIAGNFRKCKFSKKIGIGFRINFRN